MKSNISWVVIICVLILAGCTDAARKKNTAIVKKYVTAVQENDIITMKTLLADNYIGYGPNFGDSINKEMSLQMWEKNSNELYEKIEYEKSRIIAVALTEGPYKGEWVANWAQLKITYKDGRGPVQIWANSNYQIENNKIVRSFTFYNEADVMRQLGYVFVDVEDLYDE